MSANAAVFMAVILLLGPAGGLALRLFAGEGYRVDSYGSLSKHMSAISADTTGVCVAHGAAGKAQVLAELASSNACSSGLVLLGSSPTEADVDTLATARVRTLVVAGDVDGVSRFSNFAVARHRFQGPMMRFAVIEGASHHSFADGHLTVPAAALHDLRPELDASTVHLATASLAVGFLGAQVAHSDYLAAAELRAAQLAGPVVDALKLEGSAALGTDICNSDFPTNPSCNYPKYPDFALPPGPAPAPSPLPSSDCICGSKWITDYAFPAFSGASEKGFKVHAADAFHDVSDTHPFHLPHIWNNCTQASECDLNVTTLTMLVGGSGALFPNGTDAPVSAFEMRAKIKSRQTIWEAAGEGKQDPSVDKKNMTLCRNVNEMAWLWALEHADPSVRARFQQNGEPFVMVDDKVAPIGLTGPTWIKKELVYTRVSDKNANSSHVEIQSWTFIVGESPIKTKYIPSGMHYCKLLSPARAMEWIYLDGLRAHQSI